MPNSGSSGTISQTNISNLYDLIYTEIRAYASMGLRGSSKQGWGALWKV